MKRPAIFLDRDGVLNENRADYILNWSDLEIFDDSVEALSRYADSDFLFVIVTNQSPVGRGLFTLEDAQQINQQLVDVIESRGGRVDLALLCPHAPDDNCDCRKPQPGMLLQAAGELDIDLPNSYMIGDALSDLEAGIRAGVKETFLLMTGRGRMQASLPDAAHYSSSSQFENLNSALESIFSGNRA